MLFLSHVLCLILSATTLASRTKISVFPCALPAEKLGFSLFQSECVCVCVCVDFYGIAFSHAKGVFYVVEYLVSMRIIIAFH